MTAKDTFFSVSDTLNFRGRLLDLAEPVVMGILNLTTDSFYDGGKYATEQKALAHTERMLHEGATIIDLGACSTRPGATAVNEADERHRLLPVLAAIVRRFPDAPLSVDTFHASVAKAAVEHGACMINDISAGSIDAAMFETVAALKVPYVLMHMQGTPSTMQQNPRYEDVSQEVLKFFAAKTRVLFALGVHDVVIDPGFGFGKTQAHNYQLLKNLDRFRQLELPLMVGISRKSFIYKILETTAGEALNGTSVLHTIALMNGAKILRVHDVRDAMEVIKICKYYAEV